MNDKTWTTLKAPRASEFINCNCSWQNELY